MSRVEEDRLLSELPEAAFFRSPYFPLFFGLANWSMENARVFIPPELEPGLIKDDDIKHYKKGYREAGVNFLRFIARIGEQEEFWYGYTDDQLVQALFTAYYCQAIMFRKVRLNRNNYKGRAWAVKEIANRFGLFNIAIPENLELPPPHSSATRSFILEAGKGETGGQFFHFLETIDEVDSETGEVLFYKTGFDNSQEQWYEIKGLVEKLLWLDYQASKPDSS